jgi:hypothetical protein
MLNQEEKGNLFEIPSEPSQTPVSAWWQKAGFSDSVDLYLNGFIIHHSSFIIQHSSFSISLRPITPA